LGKIKDKILSNVWDQRCILHRRYVSRRMSELTTEICQEAVHKGTINEEKRQQLFKYQEHLKHVWKN